MSMKNLDAYGAELIEGDPREPRSSQHGVGKNAIRDAFRKAGYRPPIEHYIDSTNARKATVISIEDHHYRKCINCGCIFIMTPDDEKWYTLKGFDIPKRCKPCRDKRKNSSK